MDKIIIERVRTDNFNENNTSNHMIEENDHEAKKLDVEKERRKTNLMNYANIIEYNIDHSYIFSDEEMEIMKKCAEKGMKTRKMDDLLEILAPIIHRLEQEWISGKWFFRFNSRSPKGGINIYPVNSALETITMIVTSVKGWRCLCENENIIYFVPYNDNWDIQKEFRVFVHNNTITAISQYDTSTKSFLSGKSSIYIKQTVLNIIDFLSNILPTLITKIQTSNLTIDIYVDTNSIKIIECNSFGYYQSAGSCLFHWLRDKSKLYNKNDLIWIRIAK